MSADDPNKHAFDDSLPGDDEAAQPDDSEREPDAEQSNDAPSDQPANGPSSAAPPRVMAEAPLGGIARPVVNPAASEAPPEPGEQPAADDSAESPDEPEPDSGEAAVEPVDAGPDAAIPPDETPSPSADATPDDKGDSSPEAQIAARLKKLQAQESGADVDEPAASGGEPAPTGATSPEPDGSTSPAPPARGEEPLPAPSTEPEAVAEPDEWDEDISPELASVLFGAADAVETPAAEEAPAVEDGPEAAEPEAAAPAPEPEPDAPPVELTDIATVRTLPITAEKRAAPAPDTALEGKARYVRVEEPLDGDAGQRTLETWEYLKPAYPTVDAREVREVTVEETEYGDGSWLWRYERRYADRGRDTREVRANADRTYIERADEVSRLDPASGRRLQFKETAELILAGPEVKEKGGLLSGLGSLLGRDEDKDEQAGPKTWRQATPSEVRETRKQGGAAFKRGFLKRLFG